MTRRLSFLASVLLVLLAGCDQLGIESATATAARREAEGKAVGAACRHAGRAIEDCFALNRRTDKAAIYAGWREMDDYMRENKIEAVAPSVGPGAGRQEADASEDGARTEAPPAAKSEAKDKADAGSKSSRPHVARAEADDKSADKAAARGEPKADAKAEGRAAAAADKAGDKAAEKPAKEEAAAKGA